MLAIGKGGPQFEAWQNQIRSILVKFGFAKDKGKVYERLHEFIATAKKQGFELTFPDSVLDGDSPKDKDYRNLTFQQLEAVWQSATVIYHNATAAQKIRIEGELVSWADTREKILSVILSDLNYVVDDSTQSERERTLAKMKSPFTLLLRIEYALREATGNDRTILQQAVSERLSEAETRMMKLNDEFAVAYKDLVDKYNIGNLQDKKFIPELNESFPVETMIVLALNWGNEGNRNRVLDGGFRLTNAEGKVVSITEAQAEIIIRALTENEADFVNGIWELLETSFQEASFNLEALDTGLRPEKIKKIPFYMGDGRRQLNGGYYPIIYTGAPKVIEEAPELGTKMYFYLKQSTDKSHLKARANQGLGKALLHEIAGLNWHVSRVTHDLTHRLMLKDFHRIFGDKEIASALANAIKQHHANEISEWLKALAIRGIFIP